MTHPSPQQSVFTIPELVENILLSAHLSPLSLLTTRLTNKTFNLVILSARPFRERLFLDHTIRPSSSPSSNPPPTVQINPLLEKMFPAHMQKLFSQVRALRDTQFMLALGYFDTAVPDEAVLPQMVENARCRGREYEWACLGGGYEGACLHVPLVGCGGGVELGGGEEALWRSMYATRPAVPLHVVEVGANGWRHKWEVEAGTKMGEVMDSLVSGVRSWKRGGVGGRM